MTPHNLIAITENYAVKYNDIRDYIIDKIKMDILKIYILKLI